MKTKDKRLCGVNWKSAWIYYGPKIRNKFTNLPPTKKKRK